MRERDQEKSKKFDKKTNLNIYKYVKNKQHETEKTLKILEFSFEVHNYIQTH